MADLARKLGLQPGTRVCFLEPTPETAAGLRESLPAGVAHDETLQDGRYDQIYWWPQSLEGLVDYLTRLAWKITPAGAIWIVIPKAAVARRRGLGFTWQEMQTLALETDLVDNKVASLTEEEYANRFVIRKERCGEYGRTPPDV